MVNLVIAYDGNDFDLGDYFERSYANINSVVELSKEITSSIIRGLECTELNISATVTAINAKPFIFVGLSHGDDNGETLLTEVEEFVSETNAVHFKGSYFYTTACNAARNLKNSLIDNGCQCFVGYKDDSLATYEDFHDIYIECENYSINEFLRSNKTVEETFAEMLDYFVAQIIDLNNRNEILVALEITHNMYAFDKFGDTSLRQSNFVF